MFNLQKYCVFTFIFIFSSVVLAAYTTKTCVLMPYQYNYEKCKPLKVQVWGPAPSSWLPAVLLVEGVVYKMGNQISGEDTWTQLYNSQDGKTVAVSKEGGEFEYFGCSYDNTNMPRFGYGK